LGFFDWVLEVFDHLSVLRRVRYCRLKGYRLRILDLVYIYSFSRLLLLDLGLFCLFKRYFRQGDRSRLEVGAQMRHLLISILTRRHGFLLLVEGHDLLFGDVIRLLAHLFELLLESCTGRLVFVSLLVLFEVVFVACLLFLLLRGFEAS
jgi:hypothetical protein